MARSKGFFGTLGSLFRWAILGLAALFGVALYFGFTQEPEVTGVGELVLEVPEEDGVVEAVSDAVETAEDVLSGSEITDDATAEDATTESAPAAPALESAEGAVPETSDVVEVMPDDDVIRIPGDDAAYELLNAWRRDDGAIEITTQRTLDDDISTTIRLVRCAPLEVGTIAEGSGPRNDAPEMERIVLGSAAAWLAAQACGAMN